MNRFIVIAAAAVTMLLSGCGAFSDGNTYYVDAVGGSDANDGLSRSRAWKSLEKVNSTTFQPSDRILFRAGCRWTGQLRPQGSGAEGAPIAIDKYGRGELPVISQEDMSGVVVLLHNQDFWEIRNIEVDGGVARPGEMRGGIHVQATTAGRVLRHIVVSNCVVRNVYGSIKLYESCAIWVGVPGWDDPNGLTTGFDGVLIENNRIYGSDRNGILVWTTAAPGERSQFRPGLIPSRNVVIRGNTLEDIGGDAILVLGSDRPLIEHNTVRRCCLKTGDPQYGRDYNPSSAAIWLHHCENGIMQYNAVYDCRKQPWNNDGMAYDFDFNCNGNILQYNLSCNNDGGFLLIMNTATNNEARYNISVNDRDHVLFCVGSASEGNKVYNNTFYIDSGASHIVPNATFINNIFMAAGDATMSVQNPELGVFEANCYGGGWAVRPNDPAAVTEDPLFVSAGGEAVDAGGVRGYTLRRGSPCEGAGVLVENNGGRDIVGNRLPQKKSPDLGAIQSR